MVDDLSVALFSEYTIGEPIVESGAGCTVIVSEPALEAAAALLTPTFLRDLSPDMVGEDVRALQRYLNTHGFPLADSGPGSPGNETDRYGRLTWLRLMEFQRSRGLTPTGLLDPPTREIINS